MEMFEWLRRLYEYNAWANRSTIDSLKASPGAKALRALSHLVLAEKEWLSRVRASQDPNKQNFWQDLSLAECEAVNEVNRRDFAELLNSLADTGLDQFAEYQNSQGISFRTPLRDLLTHVTLHSTYHRGQVAAAIRDEGGAPAVTDYIVFQRLFSDMK